MFDFVTEKNGRRSLVLFFGHSIPEFSSIQEKIISILRSEIFPDACLFCAHKSVISKMMEQIKTDGEDLLERLHQAKIPIFFGAFEIDGSLTIQDFKKHLGSCNDFFGHKEIKTDGIKSLKEKRNPVISASSGFYFSKPSGRRSRYFIRAANLLVNHDEIDFLAWRMEGFLNAKTNHVYVDSSTITSLIHSVVKFQNVEGVRSNFPTIENFETWSGIESVNFQVADAQAIVSASQSGGMAKNLIQNHKFLARDILTICSSIGPEKGSKLLVKIEIEENNVDDRIDKAANVVGESFIAETASPRKRLITIKDGDNKSIAFFKAAIEHQFFSFSDFLNNKASPRLVSINATKLASSDYLAKWISGIVRKLPASTKCIIALIGSGSSGGKNQIASVLQSRASDIWQGQDKPNVLSLEIFDQNEKATDNGDTLVLTCDCVSSGKAFLNANRLLRDSCENGDRLFVVPIIVGPDWKTIDILEKSIIRSPPDFSYRIEKMHAEVCSSNESYFSFKRELLVWDRSAVLTSDPRQRVYDEFYEKRRSALNNASNTDVFNTTIKGQFLKLRSNYAFFKNSTPISDQFSVLAFQACMLQRLRLLSGVDGLEASPFQSVVLDPENFSRFNDGVLQSALLRSARKSELDYSNLRTESDYMKRLLLDVFSNASERKGEAAIEFALGLASRRLILDNSDYEEIKAQSEEFHPVIEALILGVEVSSL